MSTTSASLIERFWSRVDKSGECWTWMLRPDGQGYGQMNVGDKKIVRAHRLSYMLNIGEIPEGMVVMHVCDNRLCVRPDHLKLGTTSENIADCRAKGRWHNHPKAKRERVGRKGPKPLSFAERLWPKVKVETPDVCWEWQGWRDRNGYGQFFAPGRGRNGSKIYAHRVAYSLTHGAIPDGLIVMHICDNPSCCNPSHLRLGTKADNNRDRAAKGRGRENHQWGEANPAARLTTSDVAEIRRMAQEGMTQFVIADKFGIQQPQVSRIVRGKSWSKPQ